MNSKGMLRYDLDFLENHPQLFFISFRQTLVTRVDQDFDIRRVQTQAEKFLPKAENGSRGRKRKAHQINKQKSSTVRWVLIHIILQISKILFDYLLLPIAEIICDGHGGSWE